MKYFYRVQRQALKKPHHLALAWLEQNDEEERGLWVERHRSSRTTLGKVIKELYEQRESMWQVKEEDARKAPAPNQGSGGKSDSYEDSKKKAANACPGFQDGRCKKKPCPNGKEHVCQKCGMFNHGASKCRNGTG